MNRCGTRRRGEDTAWIALLLMPAVFGLVLLVLPL
jgi:hypothetical protein